MVCPELEHSRILEWTVLGMAYASSEPEFLYYVLLPHPTEPRLWIVADQDGWSLPRWQTTTQHFWQTTNYVNTTMEALFGVAVTTLRCVSLLDDAATRQSTRVYELELHSPAGALPPGGRWIDYQELAELRWSRSELRPVLETWFAEAAASVPAIRRPWARRGWFSSASSWIVSHGEQLGLERTAPIEQLRSWERSCVLRIPTTGGDLYFKALPAMFAHELEVLETLAGQHPDNFVQLPAVENDRHWMLMADMHGPSLDRIEQLDVWEQALARLAHIQIVTATQVDHFIALGCPDLRLDKLRAHIDPFFAALEMYPGLSTEDIATLRAAAPRLKDRCSGLATYRIPAALEHGDLGPSNIVISNGIPIYFDWSDASITHPFFSLPLLFDDSPAALMVRPQQNQRLRAAYLDPWQVYEPMERLEQALELAEQLAPVHHALLYHVMILPNMEARWEMVNMVAHYLRMLLHV